MTEIMDLALAQQYFAEAAATFARDEGELWGMSLAGPLIFVDVETRQIVANQPDAEGRLTPQEGVWIGEIPPEVMIANTATTWAGVHWTMVLWPSLSDDPQRRAEFIAHEAFHRIQADIGFPMPKIPNANVHLDTLDGRYWLQLEWRALERALLTENAARIVALTDALLFRAARGGLFPQAAVEERALEMHEGLAEYTGFRLSGMTAAQAADFVQRAPAQVASFVRSFAYASGAAYGLLLDALRPDWRVGLTPAADFGELLRNSLAITLPANLPEAAAARASAYDGPALWEREVARDQERQVQIAAYCARLLDGPALILPLNEVQCAFDPRVTIPIPAGGTVFPFIHVSDAWGVLDVQAGGLWMANDWQCARIVAPEDPVRRPLIGDGWTLHLAEGWEVVSTERPGNWELREPLAASKTGAQIE